MNWTLVIISWWGIMTSSPVTVTTIPMDSLPACKIAADAMRDKFRNPDMSCVNNSLGTVITFK